MSNLLFLQEWHDYNVLNCMTEEPGTLPDGTGRKDKKQVVLPDVMFESLCRINPDISEQTVRAVVDELCRTPVSGDLILTNYQNYQKKPQRRRKIRINSPKSS